MKNLNEYVYETLVDDKINRNKVDDNTVRELTMYAENDHVIYKKYEAVAKSLIKKYNRDKDNFTPDEDTLVSSSVVQKIVSDIINSYKKQFDLPSLNNDTRWAMKEAVSKLILNYYDENK